MPEFFQVLPRKRAPDCSGRRSFQERRVSLSTPPRLWPCPNTIIRSQPIALGMPLRAMSSLQYLSGAPTSRVNIINV